METAEKRKFIDSVVKALRKAAIEMEELQLQTALGKSEAKDSYETAKKRFNLFLHESKAKIKTGKEKVNDLHTKMDELRVQLNLGKAENIEAFRAQKKKLKLALHELKVKIKTNEKFKRIYAYLLIEIETFNILLEIMEDEFEPGSKWAKESFEQGKEKFNTFIEDLKAKYGKKEPTKWEHFSGELSEAFTHFKHAFSKP
ncbi:MAG: hypothetical protein HKO54_02200 [Flavobacteriaceae bacterium]|nr:hypothetical protein [Flavobacteriaceae bacterium]